MNNKVREAVVNGADSYVKVGDGHGLLIISAMLQQNALVQHMLHDHLVPIPLCLVIHVDVAATNFTLHV